MWRHYRKTFLPVQAFIVIMLAVMHFYFKVPWGSIWPFIVIMELFSIFGAMWTVRLRRKIESAHNELSR